ncbi:APO protein 1, chloroplastic-like [Aristolochia californica]|uniref:APO protein 1, chloroplastic-like n=1 Tax=Aristolochia californica TaxID=171875 RepID=UPI0035D6EBC9
MIDIPVSNCLNSNISKIYVLTHFNSASLNRHLSRAYGNNMGGYKNEGFVEVLAAQQSPENPNWFQGTADAVRQYLWLFEEHNVMEFLVLAGDHLYRMDYERFIQAHREMDADITVAALPVDEKRATAFGLIKMDEEGRIIEFVEKPKAEQLKAMKVDTAIEGLDEERAKEMPSIASMGIYVVSKDVMLKLLREKFPGANDFASEVIPGATSIGMRVQAYLYDGYWEDIGTIEAFDNANLGITKKPVPDFSFHDCSSPIYTQPRFLPPSKMPDADVTDSVIGEGCVTKNCEIHHSVVGLPSCISEGAIIEDTLLTGADSYEFSRRSLHLDGKRRGNTSGVASTHPVVKKEGKFSQNVNLPPILPKNKKKPYPMPIKKIQELARADKKLAERGIEKPLEPPKNGLLVSDLIPVADQVLEAWKVLIKGVAQLMQVVPVYGCSICPEVHVGPVGHEMQDCNGPGNARRRSFHTWVKGSVNDVLTPIESYHLYDPFGRRIKHETRFDYDRIPAVVELCIQAGVDIPEYPSRRRTAPIRMIGKKVIDRGGFVEEPKPVRFSDSSSVLAELDTYGAHMMQSCPAPSDLQRLAEETLEAYENVRRGVRKLMNKYTVKACGYCSEVHVGPWGHNAKLCGAFKHQWRDGKHGWQDATLEEVIPPNHVWHVRDPDGPPLKGALKRFYGKAPAVVELCIQAGAKIPDKYRPMMRLDIVIPDPEERQLVA